MCVNQSGIQIGLGHYNWFEKNSWSHVKLVTKRYTINKWSIHGKRGKILFFFQLSSVTNQKQTKKRNMEKKLHQQGFICTNIHSHSFILHQYLVL